MAKGDAYLRMEASKIAENTEGFFNLSASEQESIVDAVMQEKFGKIPNAQSVLARNAEIGKKPGIMDYYFDAIRAPLSSLGVDTFFKDLNPVAGFVGRGAAMAGAETAELPEAINVDPQTQFGKTYKSGLDLAQLLGLGYYGGKGLLKAGKAGLKAGLKAAPFTKEFFRGGTFRGATKLGKQSKYLGEYAKGIEAEMKMAKGAESMGAKDIATSGMEELSTHRAALQKEARDTMETAYQNIKEKVSRKDISGALRKTALKADNIETQDKIIELANKLTTKRKGVYQAGKGLGGTLSKEGKVVAGENLSAKEVQQIVEEIKRLSANPNFGRQMANEFIANLPENVGGQIAAARADYYVAKEGIRESNAVREQMLRRFALGKSNPEEVKILERAYSKIPGVGKTNNNLEAYNRAKTFALEQQMLKADKTKRIEYLKQISDELKLEADKVLSRRRTARNVAGGTALGIGLASMAGRMAKNATAPFQPEDLDVNYNK